MLVEVDSDIHGATLFLEALARVNLHDARRDRRVALELTRRCSAPAREGWLYTRDPKNQDIWSAVVPLLERTPDDAPIQADCEDMAAAYAAAACLLLPASIVEVVITQPAPGQMAHAYCLIDGAVLDPSVWNGMQAPPSAFYLSGETARIRIT
jgi:hypothetical protein